MLGLGYLLTGVMVAAWCLHGKEPLVARGSTAFIVACAGWIAIGALGSCLALALGFRPLVQVCFAFAILCAMAGGLLGVASWFTPRPRVDEGAGLSPSDD